MLLVVFNIGRIPDMIDHKQNGCQVQLFDSADPACDIKWDLENPERSRRSNLRL
ncbi:MAG: hypothetical protein KAK01_05320 [Candidatus Marinimicrobia bacterium]|nr:hypothetical protein [Candidatus Neomarinimicrobiota bacterium]